MQRARRFLEWRSRLITILVAYATFFGYMLLGGLVSSATAPAGVVAKVSVAADALIAAVATVCTFGVVALSSSRSMR